MTLTIYRVSLMFLGVHYCGCLGTVVDALPLKKTTIDWMLSGMLGLMTVSSYGIIIWLWRQKRIAMRSISQNAVVAVSEQRF